MAQNLCFSFNPLFISLTGTFSVLMHLWDWVVQRRGCLLPGSTGDLWRIPNAYQQSAGLIYKQALCRSVNFSGVDLYKISTFWKWWKRTLYTFNFRKFWVFVHVYACAYKMSDVYIFLLKTWVILVLAIFIYISTMSSDVSLIKQCSAALSLFS